MYYHVKIELKERQVGSKLPAILCELDRTNLKEIERDIIMPYYTGERFYFYGRYIKPEEIARISVLRSPRETFDYAQQETGQTRRIGDPVVTQVDSLDYEEYMADITKEVLQRVSKRINRSKTDKEKNAAKPSLTKEDPHRFIKDTLKCLGGLWENKKPVMSAQEFKRLTDYIIFIADHGKLPKTITPIEQTPATNDFIKHTIFLIYKYYEKQVKRNVWCEFILKAFTQFKNVELSTIERKFSAYVAKFEENYDHLVVKLATLTMNNLK